ncbi:MAG: 23S rRNA (uracil(1939)-C(5))-methyltransferase RlmD [Elusimicrobiota bacterium]
MPESFRLQIERMTPEGLGLGRFDRKVVFVPHCAPGDELEVAVEKARSDYAIARIVRVVRPGVGRIEPRCGHHFSPSRTPPHCGGCAWQHMTMEAQRSAKREIVRDCLFRIAKLREPRVEETAASPADWRYRNKVLIPFAADGKGRVTAGFYAHGSHDIVPFADCVVQPELSVRLTHAVRDFAASCRWKVYDRRRGGGWLRHLYVRIAYDGRALLTVVTNSAVMPDRGRFLNMVRSGFPEVTGVFQNVQPRRTTVVLGPKWIKLWGADDIEERLGTLTLGVSPPSFLQVNTPACEVLYGIVDEFLTHGGFRPELLLDLYSGIGSIALWLAPRAGQIIGVETNRYAVRDAGVNARRNGIRNVRFSCGEIESQLRFLAKNLRGASPGRAAAVLDPPRAGCSKSVLKVLCSSELGRLVYVSCNPATFARDADWLSRHGWRLTRVRPVDLFPQTSHVETAGLFERVRRA